MEKFRLSAYWAQMGDGTAAINIKLIVEVLVNSLCTYVPLPLENILVSHLS